MAARGGQTEQFWPEGQNWADVCLLSQTRGRNGAAGAVPPSSPCWRVVGGGPGGYTPPGGRSAPSGAGRLLWEEEGPFRGLTTATEAPGYPGPRGRRIRPLRGR